MLKTPKCAHHIGVWTVQFFLSQPNVELLDCWSVDLVNTWDANYLIADLMIRWAFELMIISFGDAVLANCWAVNLLNWWTTTTFIIKRFVTIDLSSWFLSKNLCTGSRELSKYVRKYCQNQNPTSTQPQVIWSWVMNLTFHSQTHTTPV